MLDTAQPALPFSDALPPAPRPARRPAASPCARAELRAARHAFLGLAARWALTGEEALRLLGEPEDDEPRREARLHALLGVGRSLLLLRPDPDACLATLRRPDPALDGASPLQVMLSGGLPGLARVRAHLAALAARP